MQDIKSISIRKLGPMKQADIDLGNLTVLVGQQATGKSIFLQTLKLLIDLDNIHKTFSTNNMDFEANPRRFMDGFYGRNMSQLWDKDRSQIIDNTTHNTIDLIAAITKQLPAKGRIRFFNKNAERYREHLFYIPAQRVISLPGGVSQDFGKYRFGDPFVLRRFSDHLHQVLQSKFAVSEHDTLTSFLPTMSKAQIDQQIYAKADLVLTNDKQDYVRKLALNLPNNSATLPFLTWSAGQREFTPLLLGLYQFFAADNDVNKAAPYIVIEEPEMGLHPQAINVILFITLDLLRRGHKVLLSTHSPQVLDMIWALGICQQKKGTPQDVLDIFDTKPDAENLLTAKSALEQQYKVYYFQRNGVIEDISDLDPSSDNPAQAHWGGLTEFAGIAGDVVSNVVNRAGF